MNKNLINSTSVKKWLFRIAMLCLIFALLLLALFYINKGPQNISSFKGARKVSIQNENGRYSFFKDGKPFIVKGGAGFTHLKELAECGGNTFICWDTSKLATILKEAAKYNLSVIVGLDIPGGEETAYYADKENTTALYNAYNKIVLRYKDDTSILAWCLGNELAMPLSLSTPPFYKEYNRLLSMIHNNDPNHPVSTAVMNVPKKGIINMQWRVPALDFVCINTYNKLKTILQDINSINFFWKGPYLVSEWAPNGGWEAEVTTWEAPIENTSTKKAEQYYEFFTRYMPLNDTRFLGSMAFYWGSRQEYTFTWYGVYNEDGTPTEIKETLNDCWKHTHTGHSSPKLQYMLIDSLGARDNIIVSPGSEHLASVALETLKPGDSLKYYWQILKEDWLYWGHTWRNFKKPPAEKGLLKDSTFQQSRFLAPLKEGPYRVFVTVYNSKGYCATANTPIYVVE